MVDLFLYAILSCADIIASVSPFAGIIVGIDDSLRSSHSGVLVLVTIVVLQALSIALLLHRRYRGKAAEAVLHRKEEEIEKSEERFSKAFRQCPVAITLVTAKGYKYIDVNENYEHLTGFRREEVLGRSVLDIELWVDPNERRRAIREFFAQGRLRDLEFRLRRKDGSIRIAQESAELIEIAGEQCVLSIAVDITGRKQAEQALAESERRFRLMAESAPVLIWLTGADQRCTDVNSEWLRFTGRNMSDELGEGWRDGIHADDLQAFNHAYVNAFNNRLRFVFEHRLRRFDGVYRWMRNDAAPRFTGDAEFAGHIGCCIDITDERETRVSRAEFGSKLIQAQEEERARIARELHDDINQRLALLANGLERLGLNNGQHVEPDKQELDILWQLTNDIATDIQHISHQLHPSKLHYLGLAAAARDLCHEVSRQYKIEIECNTRDLPQDINENISLSLFRIIQESLHNVAKHSHAHHVKVELTCESTLLRLRVSDDGSGFDPDNANNSGLGLVSMGERVKSVGGQFCIWSRPDLGTQVEVIVPVIRKSVQLV